MSQLRLTDRALVRVTGEDWRGFLQGLLTQDVETIGNGELRYGALLTPQGRLLVDLFILGTDDGVLLDVAADRREDLIRRLTMYRLRSKVKIAAVAVSFNKTFGEAPGAGWPADPRLADLGWRGSGRDGHPRGLGCAPDRPGRAGHDRFRRGRHLSD